MQPLALALAMFSLKKWQCLPETSQALPSASQRSCYCQLSLSGKQQSNTEAIHAFSGGNTGALESKQDFLLRDEQCTASSAARPTVYAGVEKSNHGRVDTQLCMLTLPWFSHGFCSSLSQTANGCAKNRNRKFFGH